MIEVEIRGRLTRESFRRLKEFLEQHGKHVESHEREMLMLRDYPGYAEDPTTRDVDIRLRNTSGRCEIMMKRKVGDHRNVAREEISLGLSDHDLMNARAILRGLGFTKANRMIRKKDLYAYHDIEWSLVRAPKEYYYFEAEQRCKDRKQVQRVQEHLFREAEAQGLTTFTPDETRNFIQQLDRDVNIIVDL